MIGLVYCITNAVNAKQYVGITIQSIKKRWGLHEWHSRYGTGCPLLSKAIAKYGIKNFSVEQIDEAHSLDDLREKEIQHIARLNTKKPHGYNICEGGKGSMGREYSEYTKSIISRKAKERAAVPGSKEIRSEKMKRFYAAHPEAVSEISDRAKKNAGVSFAKAWTAEVRAKRAATQSDPEWHRMKAEATSAGRLAAIERKRAAGEPIYEKSENYKHSTEGTTFSAERCAQISAQLKGKKRGPYKITGKKGL